MHLGSGKYMFSGMRQVSQSLLISKSTTGVWQQTKLIVTAVAEGPLIYRNRLCDELQIPWTTRENSEAAVMVDRLI